MLRDTAHSATTRRQRKHGDPADPLPVGPECLSRRPTTRLILSAPEPKVDSARFKPEAQKLIKVLNAHNWSRKKTAAALGISRNTLWRRMKEYGLLQRHSP
jgi:transcriptional regulator of acetoin/glycerol metabolism